MTNRRVDRNNDIGRGRGCRPRSDFSRLSEVLLQPQAEVGSTAKMGLVQDSGDIIELNVFVFVHVMLQMLEGNAHSKKLTQ